MRLSRWAEVFSGLASDPRGGLRTGSVLQRYLLVLMVSVFGLFVASPDVALSADWKTEEGTLIENGLDSEDTVANAVGEVSVKYENNAGENTTVTSPTSPADTRVQHLSKVVMTTPEDTPALSPGDTVDVGITLTNTGNGFDSYVLQGDFVDSSIDWDTNVFLDTDRDSSGVGEPTTDRVNDLAKFGDANDDTGLVLRFRVPDTATAGSTEAYKFNATSSRTEDPVPGADTLTFTVRVIDTGLVGIQSPADNHDTKVRSITVSGTSAFTDSGDSVEVSVNGSDTKATAVAGDGSWSIADVTLSDMGDSVRAFLHNGGPGASLRDTDGITINYDPIADTFPQNFGVSSVGPDTVGLTWSSFSSIPGSDPDTGTGFSEYLVVYDTNTRPDSTSTHWDGSDTVAMGNIGTNSTVISGLNTSETYVFRIGYRDNVGNISRLSTGDTGTTGTPSSIALSTVRNTSSDSALRADGSGTIGIRVTWTNTGDQDGTVSLDTGDLVVHDSKNNVLSGIERSLREDTALTVPGGSTASGVWWIHAPDTDSQELPGAYEVSYQESDTRAFINIADVVQDVQVISNNIDAWSADLRGLRIQAGVRNDEAVHDTDVVRRKDSIVVMHQRGDSSYIDTPVINPGYGFETRTEFKRAVEDANRKLTSTLNEPVSTTLINISLWKEEVGGSYIGAGDVIKEDFRVEVTRPSNPNVNPDKIKVAKLLTDKNEWYVIDEDPEVRAGKIVFDVSSNAFKKGSGFSVFRLVTGPGVSTVGSASEAIVYPNPFVPFDGDPETGEYGTGKGQGIYFAAGKNRGFPAGTELKIYTITGELVVQKDLVSPGIIQWEGRTRHGDRVRSGVYVYRITTPDGSEKVGKLSIVR